MDLTCTRVFEKAYKQYSKNIYRQIVLYGGSRSSKTWSLMQMMLIKLLNTPNIKITVWRNQKVTCRATIMADFIAILKQDLKIKAIFSENKQQALFVNKLNGAQISFEGADSDDKVLGLAQDISIFNEITGFNEQVYLQITQRTSQTIFADYNPSKRFWFERMKLRDDTIFLHSYYRDNAYCPEFIRLQLEGYEPWETNSYEVVNGVAMYRHTPISEKNQPPPNLKNIKEGTANVYMWLVFGLGLEAEKPNKIYHGWRTISNEDYDLLPYKKYYGLDFGSSNPNAFIEVKFDGEKTFYLHEKLYKPLNDMTESLPEALDTILGDDKGKATIVADSAKRAQVRALKKEGFIAIGAQKGPGSVNLGISLCQKFNVFYTKSSKNIDGEQAVYEWMEDRYGKATDDPLKANDHAMDAIRYIITYLYRFLNIKVKL